MTIPRTTLLLMTVAFLGGLLVDSAMLRLGAQTAADNPELARMYAEDQSDRRDAEKIGWEKISERDAARLTRAKTIYQADGLKTGGDYYHAAMILQHSMEAGDYLLAHELCIVAIGKGDDRAKWLAAATEDRFMMDIGRPQRFGTQYRPEPPGSDGPIRLYKVDDGVTDGLRREFKAPSRAEARAKESMFNKK
jgi:hypothetical protein